MNVVKHEGIYKASRITGPKHNFLGLAVTPDAPPCIQCVQRRMPGDGTCEIDEARLMSAVSEGVSRANRELRSPLFVEQIEYVPTDTPDYGAYIELAKSIVCWASSDFN